MLREVKKLHGVTLRAYDGDLGSVDEILFDDQSWTVRYLAVNTGGWLSGRSVLLSPVSLGVLDWEKQVLEVNLTRAQVEDSPGIETDEPVSRQWETDIHNYYGWPYYWGMGGTGTLGTGMVGSPWYFQTLLMPDGSEAVPEPGDVHLRSTREVTGYGVTARDGDIGHIADFLVDDDTWRIRCLAVDTRDWWPGKQVLLPLDWISQISWLDRKVMAGVTRDQIRNAPYWEPGKPFSPAFLEQLARYHTQEGYGMPEDLRTQEAAAVQDAAFAGRS